MWGLQPEMRDLGGVWGYTAGEPTWMKVTEAGRQRKEGQIDTSLVRKSGEEVTWKEFKGLPLHVIDVGSAIPS
jgi:hypothetical protein